MVANHFLNQEAQQMLRWRNKWAVFQTVVVSACTWYHSIHRFLIRLAKTSAYLVNVPFATSCCTVWSQYTNVIDGRTDMMLVAQSRR